MTTTETIKVDGMTCGGCEDNVRRALSQMPGVTVVEPDHTTDTVRVTFEASTVDAQTIRERIDEIGYQVLG